MTTTHLDIDEIRNWVSESINQAIPEMSVSLEVSEHRFDNVRTLLDYIRISAHDAQNPLNSIECYLPECQFDGESTDKQKFIAHVFGKTVASKLARGLSHDH